jgi:hypothetical protein
MAAMRIVGLFSLSLLACNREDPEFVRWTEAMADAHCECAEAALPAVCAHDIPPELALSDKNVAEKSEIYRGKGGERSSAALKKGGACSRKIDDWKDAHPGWFDAYLRSLSRQQTNLSGGGANRFACSYSNGIVVQVVALHRATTTCLLVIWNAFAKSPKNCDNPAFRRSEEISW